MVATVGGEDDTEPFLQAVRARIRVRDVLLLAAVPVVLGGVFLLPVATRQAYVLAYLEPTVTTAFTAHYVHLTGGHLAANLLGYLVVVPIAYLLSLLGGRRREFFMVFVTVLVVFPFVISFLNVLIERPRIGFGFSGLMVAFLGFLPLPITWYLQDRFGGPIHIEQAPFLFLVGIVVIAGWGTPMTDLTLFVLGGALVGGVGYLQSILANIDGSPVVAMRRAKRNVGHFEFAASGLAVFTLLPFAAFPADPLGYGTVMNVYTHLLGYCFGFLVPFVAFILLRPDDGETRTLWSSLGQ